MHYSETQRRQVSTASEGTESVPGQTENAGRASEGSGPVFAAIFSDRDYTRSRKRLEASRYAAQNRYTSERFRFALTLFITIFYLGFLGLMFYLDINPSSATMQTRQDASGKWVVSWILPAGTFYENGARTGDVITQVDGRSVSTLGTLPGTLVGYRNVTVQSAKTGEEITIPFRPVDDNPIRRWTFAFLGLIFVGVGGPVFVKARQRTAASAFYVFCVSTAVTLALAVGIASNIGWVQSLLFVSLGMFAGTFAFFFLEFPSRAGRTQSQHKALITALLVIGLLCMGSYTTVMDGNVAAYEWVKVFMYLYLVGCVGAGVYNLVRPLLSAHSPDTLQQLQILMFGTLLAVGIPLLLSVLPLLFAGREIVSIYYTAVALALLPLTFAYAITQHQLLGVRGLVRRSVVYLVMGSSVLLVFSLSATALSAIIPEGWERNEIGLIGFSFFVFLIAFSFSHLQHRVEHLVDRFIYHDAYDYKTALLQFSSQLASEQNLAELADQLVERTCRLMNLVCGALLVASNTELESTSLSMSGSAPNTNPLTDPLTGLDLPPALIAMNGSASYSGRVTTHDKKTAMAAGLETWSPESYLAHIRQHRTQEEQAQLRVYAKYGDMADVMVAGLQDELLHLGVELHGSDISVMSLASSPGISAVDNDSLQRIPTLIEDCPDARVGLLSDAVAMPGVTEVLNTKSLGEPPGDAEQDLARSFLGVPLWTRSRFVGVLCLAGKKSGERFTRDDLSLLNTLGSQAALAIYNAQLFEAREQALLDTIAALAHAIEAKDGYTSEHCEKMTDRAVAVAQAMGLSRREVENVKLGAMLHDVGKIGIPDAVLNKPAKLTPAEYEIIKQHATIGASIVQTVQALKGVVPIVRHHQERYDGSGYPMGLAKEDIPVGARIIGVVDTYGAMTEDRVYRKAPGHARAIAELQLLAGKQFDPEVVAVFVQLLKERPELGEHAEENVETAP